MPSSKSASRQPAPYSKKTQVEQLFELLLDVQARSTQQLSAVTRALGELQNYLDQNNNALRNDNLLVRADMQATNNCISALTQQIQTSCNMIDSQVKSLQMVIVGTDQAVKSAINSMKGPDQFWKDRQWWMIITIVMLVILLGLTWGFDLPNKVNELRGGGHKVEQVLPDIQPKLLK